MSLLENLAEKKSVAKAVLIGVALITLGLVASCKNPAEHIGNHPEKIGCQTLKYQGEIFELDVGCGRGLVVGTARDVVSESGKHRASFRVTCGAGYCISDAVIVEYY